jgi:hypothetical protein
VNPVFLHRKLSILMVFRETLPAIFLPPNGRSKSTFFAEGDYFFWLVSKLFDQILDESLLRARKERQIALQASAGAPLFI